VESLWNLWGKFGEKIRMLKGQNWGDLWTMDNESQNIAKRDSQRLKG
jgi:hypothetical protein